MAAAISRKKSRSSSQDRGVGRNPSFPHTTKRAITTNLKTTNKQKCQKIKLHGTPTTKELRKHSTRLVGRRWAARQMEETRGQEAHRAG